MRIFYASDISPDSTFHSSLWRSNLYLSLVAMGHDVIEFQYDLNETFLNLDTTDAGHLAFIAQNRPKVTAELLLQVRAAHEVRPVDLFFSYFYDACVMPEGIDQMRAMGITTVNWYCNGSYQLHLVSEISPRYDWCLVPEKFRLKDYVEMGARPIYCQEAANPDVYKPYDLPVEFDVTFIGQAYGERPAYIQYLLDQDIDVRVWGRNWPRALPPYEEEATVVEGERPIYGGGILADDEMIRMFSRSKINLGFSVCGETHRTGKRILQVRLRDFEVPMSGGFYLVEYMEELEEFFEVGKEIVCYRDHEDLLNKIRYYLAHDRERETIRRDGHERCLRDHSWQKRFEAAFAEMGLGSTT